MPAIQITGMTELRRELAKLEDVATKEQLKRAFLDAADYAATRARGRVPSRTGRAAKSIQAFSTAGRAGIKGGGTIPYYGWLDFGSRTPVRGNPRKRGPWAGSGKGPTDGRFIYPTIAAESDKIVEVVSGGLEILIREAGLGG